MYILYIYLHIYFILFRNLLIRTKEGSEILEKRFGKKIYDVAMKLSGDFNINSADDTNPPLIDYVQRSKIQYYKI